MNKLNKIKLEIFESYENGLITESEKDELLYVVEKRTKEQYAKEKFKKQYHFVPDKPGSDQGTITINGEKRHIDIGKSRYINVEGEEAPRQMSADQAGKRGDIFVDKNFFKFKNKKRRDALLQHEFGHTKLHAINGDSTTADPRSFSQKNKGIAKRTLFNQAGPAVSALGYDIHSNKEIRNALNDELDKKIPNSKEYKKRSDENSYRKKRDELLTHASKYRLKDTPHANEQEFEADRYAANKAGASNLKRAVREHYKRYKSDAFKNNNLTKEEKKSFNKHIEADMKARSKALKDKKLRDADLYK